MTAPNHDKRPYRDANQALQHQLAKAEDELAHYRAKEQGTFACPSCGAPNAPTASFCSRCGADLQPADLRHLTRLVPRNVIVVAVLSIVTLSLYNIYLVYAWTKELNSVLREERRSPGSVALISIVTCGMGALVYECLIARDLHAASARARRPLLNPSLEKLVLGLNIAALVLGFVGITAPLGMILGAAATAIVQKEINHLHAAGSPEPKALPATKALPPA